MQVQVGGGPRSWQKANPKQHVMKGERPKNLWKIVGETGMKEPLGVIQDIKKKAERPKSPPRFKGRKKRRKEKKNEWL